MNRWILLSGLLWACTNTEKQSDIVDADEDGFDMLSDCDDFNAMINPEAQELCDGFDNDCDGLIDDADTDVDTSSGTQVYPDLDGDGFAGEGETQAFCVIPDGWYLSALDCDDSDAAVSPTAQEACDGFDNNCNGLIDDADGSVANTSLYYVDADGDGYGNATFEVSACVQPANYVDNNADCDDGTADVHPAAQEVCDDIDNDCDALIDADDDSVDLSSAPLWYSDGDGDGYGDSATTIQICSRPSGYVADSSDCNDGDGAISPNAVEICDGGTDNDCNGFADDSDIGLDLSSAPLWYSDGDGDGDGDASLVLTQCESPSGYVGNGTDCDDSNPALEGLDTDGDGFSTCDGDCDDANISVLACDVCIDSGISTSLGVAVASGLSTGSGDDFTTSCGATGEDVVYEWTAPATAMYHFSVNANYNAAIAIYDGCYGNELACEYDSSGTSVDFQATEGVTYTIVIDAGSNNAVGNLSLDITTDYEVACGDGVDEDNDGLTDCDDELECWYDLACANTSCPNYYIVDLQTFLVPQGDNILTATLEGASDNLQGSCYPYSGGRDVTYDYESPETGCAQISVVSDDVDVSMMVTEGCGGAELSCGDDFPYLANYYGTAHAAYTEVNMVSGDIYIISVDAPAGLDEGAFSLNVNINTTVNCDGTPISR